MSKKRNRLPTLASLLIVSICLSSCGQAEEHYVWSEAYSCRTTLKKAARSFPYNNTTTISYTIGIESLSGLDQTLNENLS
jgi:hypothetical protein